MRSLYLFGFLSILTNFSAGKAFVFTRSRRVSLIQSLGISNLTRICLPSDDAGDEKKKRILDSAFMSISISSFLQQAAVPLADVVDGAFLSRLDPSSLGGMGVARASQAAVSKLYNSPLSKTSISLIASKAGPATRRNATMAEKDELSNAVTSGLVLGFLVGVMQLIVFTALARPIIAATGIPDSSSMHRSAISYMRARAMSAPSATLWLVATGAFRGLGDATTPFVCALLFNVLNFILDPIFIFRWKLGVSGAALTTAVSQTIALVPLLWILNRRVSLRFRGPSELLKPLRQYIKASFYLLGRSVARIAAFSYCSRQSALLGSVSASAYSIMYQLGFWITMLCESVSISVQSLLSRQFADHSQSGKSLCAYVVRRSLQAGMFLSVTASLVVYIFQYPILSLFTSNVEIQQEALVALPLFLLTQLIKGFIFPVNGILMGEMNWRATFFGMCLANLACFAALRFGTASIGQLWIAWTAYYLAQGVMGLVLRGIWRRPGDKLKNG